MADPYRTLGVDRNASDEEIKKAYRDLARKYHPDRYTSSPDMAELANEKMKEINSAYEMIQSERSGGGSRSYQGGGYSSGYSENPGAGSSNDPVYQQIRQMINSENLYGAETKLFSVDEGSRGAEWCYLYACILTRRQRYVDAQYYFNRACELDPYNSEYLNARSRFNSHFSSRQGGYSSNSDICSPCNICTIFMCADCCCDCC